MDKLFLLGLLILGCFITALSAPSHSVELDYQDDDYEYGGDDENAGNHLQGHHATSSNRAKPYFEKHNVTVTGIIGKDIVLQCDAKNLKENVILWYKNSQLIVNGNKPLSHQYSLSPSNPNDLVILQATEDSQGKYHCDVEPDKVRKNFHVVVAENSMEAIYPESSVSSASATSPLFMSTLLLVSVITLCRR